MVHDRGEVLDRDAPDPAAGEDGQLGHRQHLAIVRVRVRASDARDFRQVGGAGLLEGPLARSKHLVLEGRDEHWIPRRRRRLLRRKLVHLPESGLQPAVVRNAEPIDKPAPGLGRDGAGIREPEHVGRAKRQAVGLVPALELEGELHPAGADAHQQARAAGVDQVVRPPLGNGVGDALPDEGLCELDGHAGGSGGSRADVLGRIAARVLRHPYLPFVAKGLIRHVKSLGSTGFRDRADPPEWPAKPPDTRNHNPRVGGSSPSPATMYPPLWTASGAAKSRMSSSCRP